MKLRYFLLTVIVLCGILSAQAQTLVIYDARDLFPKDAWNPPCKAVFTEDYYYSEEWQSLNERINSYLLYQEAKDNPDWGPLADEEFREMVEKGKNLTPEGLRKAICRHAVGGRMFVKIQLFREKPYTMPLQKTPQPFTPPLALPGPVKAHLPPPEPTLGHYAVL